MYMQQLNNINEEILEDYNYDYLQETVIVEEDEFFPKYDVEEMLSINPDFKGWLYIPDTPINYPVVQGNDNSYYLNRSFEREYSKFGSIFMMSGVDYDADNIVLHGHNMGNTREEMFSTLRYYQDTDFVNEHNSIYFSHIEEDKEAEYKIFAVLHYNFNNPDDFYYMIPEFEDEEEYKAFVAYLMNNSMYETDFIPTGQILILSTCYNIYGDDNRLLVCASKID